MASATLLLGAVSAQNGYSVPAPSNGYAAPPVNGNGGYSYGPSEAELALLALGENIPGGGVAGEDYPVLAAVPETGFACEETGYPYGYYADTAPDAGCQVFHICQTRPNGYQKDSFLCPNGTIFNQQYLVCDWWFNIDCSQATSFYSVNEFIGQEPNGYGANGVPSSAYGVPGVGNGNGNGNGRNGNGNGRSGNGYNGSGVNGNGNGNGRNGNRNGNGYSQNGNGNGIAQNGNGLPLNGNGNGLNGAATAPSTSYGAPF
ncbi:uncharacterized protein LOC143028775 [Oratosquilla oratoria]|uniref:uncharacterized protein LOC143028775 n=1 Tax=Oratosquilla oratoria TaxID=337810 RepID=UPI003F75844C